MSVLKVWKLPPTWESQPAHSIFRNTVFLRFGITRNIWRSELNFSGHRDRAPKPHKTRTVGRKPERMGFILISYTGPTPLLHLRAPWLWVIKTSVSFLRSLLCKYIAFLNGSMREFARRLSADSTVFPELIAIIRALNVRTSPPIRLFTRIIFRLLRLWRSCVIFRYFFI